VLVREEPSVVAEAILKLPDTGTRLRVDPVPVDGGYYQATCQGVRVEGDSWYRVWSVRGVSVGRAFVAARLVAVDAPATSWTSTRCQRVLVRAAPSTDSRIVARIDEPGTSVLVDASPVSGGYYEATCQGRPVAGYAWYRVRSIEGVPIERGYLAAALVY
jgi:hypothetical protein